MSNYFSFNTVKPKRSKKYIVAVVCALVFLLVCVYIIGIIALMNGEHGQEISAAVSENVQLKQALSEKDAEIERLNNEIASLRGELDSRSEQDAEPPAEPADEDYTTEPDYYDDEYISPRYGM